MSKPEPRDAFKSPRFAQPATFIRLPFRDDLAGVAKVIDAATASGANSVQSLEFLLKNDAAVRAQALRDATVEARANAGC